jgi:hypothetical protein
VLNKILRIGSAILLTLAVIAVWQFIQIRSDFYARTSVSLAAKFAEEMIASVNLYYGQYQRFPPALSAVNLPSGEPGYTPEVSIDPLSGKLTVSIVSVEGKYGTIHYIPRRLGPGLLQWQCSNATVAREFLPPQCGTAQ